MKNKDKRNGINLIKWISLPESHNQQMSFNEIMAQQFDQFKSAFLGKIPRQNKKSPTEIGMKCIGNQTQLLLSLFHECREIAFDAEHSFGIDEMNNFFSIELFHIQKASETAIFIIGIKHAI